MSARTSTEYRALAKTTKGLAHLASCRNTGTWVSRCGRQIRGNEILEWRGEQAGVQAVALGDQFCEECRAEAIRTAGTISDGVAILLSLDPADDSAPQLLEVPVASIAVDGKLREPGDLVDSVATNGVTVPIVARRSPDGLVLVAGGRRLLAAIAAGLETIPTIVRDLDDEHTLVQQLLDNLHRQDLDPVAQALAYQDALDRLRLTKQALADGLGVSRPVVSNAIRLLALPLELQAHVAVGRISIDQARYLLRFEGDEQAELAAAMLEQRRTRAVAPRAKVDPALADVAALLTRLLDAKVKVIRSGDRAKITLDVPETDLARVLAQLGVAA